MTEPQQTNLSTINIDHPYMTYIAENFFYICKNKHVIEIAPYIGWHTNIIKNIGPKTCTLVEANQSCYDQLLNNFPSYNIINADVFDFYQDNRPADVVITCGLLYHLHSPFYLLEQIANKSNPEYIIIDTIGSDHNDNLHFILDGEINTPGMRFSDQPKTIRWVMLLPMDILILAMEQLGYSAIYVDNNIQRFNIVSKFGYMILFKKIHVHK